MNRISWLIACCLWSPLIWAQTVPAPADFLGYELGTQFTYHHQVVSYVKAVAEASPRVILQPYGRTHEGRELVLAILSSPENLARLESIRQDHLRRTGLLPGTPSAPDVPIIWLSYNIHGNESVSTEAAMKTLHYLATQDPDKWLDRAVVILDPCINPDGRDRYVNWYRQVVHATPNAYPADIEHHEPWPGGRFNHYLFDLNRDWCWQTQLESRLRVAQYQQWMPHVHCDFHEMGYRSTYYFAPAAKPYHDALTPWQREFQTLAGQHHARHFDQQGWLYFTRQVYDLLYPSYGDTWPMMQGAQGFTYEQGGSGRAGLGILLPNGDTLTLADRIAHHYTTSLSTIEATLAHQDRMLREFDTYFSQAQKSPAGPWKTYVIKGDQPAGKLQALTALLDRNGISWGQAASALQAQGFDYQQQKNTSFAVSSGDLLISAFQPRSTLLRVLFDPNPRLEDSLTYDLTAWAVPYAMGLKAYATSQVLAVTPYQPPVVTSPAVSGKPYAWLIGWTDHQQAQLLAEVYRAGIQVRTADVPLVLGGKTWPRGTLVITRADNPRTDLDQVISQLSQAHRLVPTLTGFTDNGQDLGSGDVRLLRAPRIAVVGGPGVSATSFGEIWHYFEQDLRYPADVIHTTYLGELDLNEFDQIILPDGRYGRYAADLEAYADKGGQIIALEGAVAAFAGRERNTLLAEAVKTQADDEDPAESDERPAPQVSRYGDRERSDISNQSPGCIYAVTLDETHPLSYGIGAQLYLLKTQSVTYPALPSDGWTVGLFGQAPVSGFIGATLKSQTRNSLAVGTEDLGEGRLIYVTDSPIFRGFWHSGKLLLDNAIFQYGL